MWSCDVFLQIHHNYKCGCIIMQRRSVNKAPNEDASYPRDFLSLFFFLLQFEAIKIFARDLFFLKIDVGTGLFFHITLEFSFKNILLDLVVKCALGYFLLLTCANALFINGCFPAHFLFFQEYKHSKALCRQRSGAVPVCTWKLRTGPSYFP